MVFRLAVAAASQMWIHGCDRGRDARSLVSQEDMCTRKCPRLDVRMGVTLDSEDKAHEAVNRWVGRRSEKAGPFHGRWGVTY